MGQTNLLLENWLQQEKIFIDNLAISRKRPTKDSVHDLRVAVKKLRSYLRLNKQLTDEEWKESFSKILSLFKSFGRLRDFDLSLNLTRKCERKEAMSFSFFKEYLSVNRTLARKWAKQEAIKFNDQEQAILKQEFNLALTNAEVCEKIIQLSTLKIKKVKSLSKHFQKNAHAIRKQLKDIYYWLKICPKDLVESFINMKALDRMLNYLGSWQDHSIFRKKIKQFIQDLPKKNEEKVMLKNLEKSLIITQTGILDKASKKWKELVIKKVTVPVALSVT